MNYYVQILLLVLFWLIVLAMAYRFVSLVFALFCELFNWYDASDRYVGPFSKHRRK